MTISGSASAIVLACLLHVGCSEAPLVGQRSAAAGSDTSLAWVGDTHLRINETYLPAHMAPANRSIEVYTQTYPMAAAESVELFWANADYSAVDSVVMDFDVDNTGLFGSNRQWRAEIPASSVVAGQDLHYWVRAQDKEQEVLWDSAGGANYSLHPKGYQVGWIGGFGAYRPVNEAYEEGALFNEDNSSSSGCINFGVSFSSYRSRAVRVYVPGLTDQEWNQNELAAAQAILQTELITDASVDGIQSTQARFARRVGNDFLYSFQFVRFNPGCLGIEDGTYGFKLRASVDGGQSWLWRGTEIGAGGGDELNFQYGDRCSYFNNPYNCVPYETALAKSIADQPLGSVIDYGVVGLGQSSSFSVDLVGDDTAITLSNLRLEGLDADQYTIELFDSVTNEAVAVDGSYVLSAGVSYRAVLAYFPTQASPGVLPHSGSVNWTETYVWGEREVKGVYLRGRSD